MQVGRKGRRTRNVMPFHAAVLAVLTPPLAAVITLLLFGAAPISPILVASALAPAYLVGALPAFLAGRLDGALVTRGRSRMTRLACFASLGAISGLLILVPFYLTGRIGGAMPLLVPASFAIAAAAALCLAMLLARALAFDRYDKGEEEQRS